MTVSNQIDITTQADFDRWVMEESKNRPVVVDFWAPWCGPCKKLGPILEKLAGESKGMWLLAKLNTEELPAVAKQFGIKGLPTVKAFKDEAIVDEFVGLLPEEHLRMWLDEFVPSEADALANTALRLEEKEDWAGAQAEYQKAIDIKPQHNMSLLGMARVSYHQGDKEEAVRFLNRVITDKDDIAQGAAQLRLVMQSAEVGDVGALQQRLEKDENDKNARYLLGVALSTQGQHEAALEALLTVIQRCNQEEETDLKDKARQAMIEIFDVVGFQDPLSQRYRSKLAQVLYS